VLRPREFEGAPRSPGTLKPSMPLKGSNVERLLWDGRNPHKLQISVSRRVGPLVCRLHVFIFIFLLLAILSNGRVDNVVLRVISLLFVLNQSKVEFEIQHMLIGVFSKTASKLLTLLFVNTGLERPRQRCLLRHAKDGVGVVCFKGLVLSRTSSPQRHISLKA
jgi:hypothetical protein